MKRIFPKPIPSILVVLALGLLFFGASKTFAKSKAIPSQDAVAYQINSHHTGAIEFPHALHLPLTRVWERNLDGQVSYPLIADGKVIVTYANQGNYGTHLIALNQSDGKTAWGPISIGGTYFWSNAAYDAGKIFVVNFDGLLKTFRASDGGFLWSVQLPGQYAFSSPPTAKGGLVYVGGAGSGGTLYAVDETNGDVKWQKGVANGDHSSPVVSRNGVYVSYPCNTYKFDPKTGKQKWNYYTGCDGGGGNTSVLASHRLFVRDWSATPNGVVLNSKTGKAEDKFASSTAPAISRGTAFFLENGTLRARNVDTLKALWSFAGDGQLSSAPLVINHYVFVGSGSGKLYGLRATTGRVVWHGKLGSPILGPDEWNVSQPLTGLGAGDGILIVPASSKLVAYR